MSEIKLGEAPKEFIIICSYCNRCYGERKNGKTKYFSPREITDVTVKMSHGDCQECEDPRRFKK